ncbi:universal stress protein [Halorussus sp. MSC15.2]|uniref:universal stress protein n=1 Tax=Halorussus sp. MSC15.2 TaxID=2283638 RepID=UPI0013D3FBA4|nr:universal stress protein [Halorussus sp. MSC15.2]NEU58981.1 universal stress protein [Halorussus sp. MSC15.2]
MTRVVVPVRYPPTAHSERTLAEAVRIAEERGAALTVLHVNLYHRGGEVSRADLKRAVEAEFGRVPNVRYVVRDGFLVEETILEEVAAEGADVVVIGHKQAGRWRRALRKLTSDPDIEAYLREKLDAEIVTVGRD